MAGQSAVLDGAGIEEISVPELFVGKSLRELNFRRDYKVLVLAAGPAENLAMTPPASYVLEKDHVLVVMGEKKYLEGLPQALPKNLDQDLDGQDETNLEQNS